MILNYNTGKEIISDYEDRKKETYIGFITPNGDYISFNNLLGGRSFHGEAWNPVSYAFLSYASYILKNTDVNTAFEWAQGIENGRMQKNLYEKNHYPGMKEIVLRGVRRFNDCNHTSIDDFLYTLEHQLENTYRFRGYDMMVYDLLVFFKNAYANKTFFETIGTKLYADNQDYIHEKYNLDEKSYDDAESFYLNYLKKQVLSYQKDILVQYLGYDSIERFSSSVDVINNDIDNFEDVPRIIMTSDPNPYERFYNYLLMDWQVQRLPRYYWHEDKKKYEVEDSFMQYHKSSTYEKLEQELNAIKKCTSRLERKKYFRN